MYEVRTSRRVPVLVYHKVGQPPAGVRNPRTYVTPEQFRWQMGLLHRMGYRTVTPEELVLHYHGQRPLAGRVILITFDDGSRSCYEVAWPILLQYRFTALFFLVAGRLGSRNDWDRDPVEAMDPLLTATQAREMALCGASFGAHTLTHPRLPNVPLAEAGNEIVLCKQRLEDELDLPVDHFAYPYGAYLPEHLPLVEQAGYHAGFTTHHRESGLFAIRRENIHLEVHRLRFLWRFLRARRGAFRYVEA